MLCYMQGTQRQLVLKVGETLRDSQLLPDDSTMKANNHYRTTPVAAASEVGFAMYTIGVV